MKNGKQMWARIICSISTVAAAACVVAVPGCLIDSNCISDDDCSLFEQCNLTTGDCFLECSAESPECPVSSPICLFDEFRCVECTDDDVTTCTGDTPHCLFEAYSCVECLFDVHCGEGEECVSNECWGAAPTLALIDYNTASETFGEVVDLEDLRGQVVLIFFAGLG